jgi:hypothetical protein
MADRDTGASRFGATGFRAGLYDSDRVSPNGLSSAPAIIFRSERFADEHQIDLTNAKQGRRSY